MKCWKLHLHDNLSLFFISFTDSKDEFQFVHINLSLCFYRFDWTLWVGLCKTDAITRRTIVVKPVVSFCNTLCMQTNRTLKHTYFDHNVTEPNVA